jgi:hypothetical protein
VGRVLRARGNQAAMRTELAAACLVAALLGATAAHAQSQPTASEIFDLRTKCHQLSKQLLAEIQSGSDGTVVLSEESNYSIKKNRCFSKISYIHTKNNSTSTIVWDAQTSEQLTWTLSGPNGDVGSIFDKNYHSEKGSNYRLTMEYTEMLMSADN